MATDREKNLSKIDTVFHYPDILRAIRKDFPSIPREHIDYMAIAQWVSNHIIYLNYDIKETLIFRLRQDLWDNTDPDKLEQSEQ